MSLFFISVSNIHFSVPQDSEPVLQQLCVYFVLADHIQLLIYIYIYRPCSEETTEIAAKYIYIYTYIYIDSFRY